MDNVKDQILDKADALCSKLPLDKINQKLGGKFDVNSKKVRLLFGAGILGIFIVIVALVFSLFGSPSLTDAELAKAKQVAAEKLNVINIKNIEFFDHAKTIAGEGLVFNAEGEYNGKVEEINILVIRDFKIVDVMRGHCKPGDYLK